MFVGQRAQTLHKGIRRRTHTALTLNRFNQECRGLRTDCGLCAFEVVKVDIFETFEQRQEALVHLFLIARRNRRHRAAVKGVFEGDDFVPVAALALVVSAGGLDRTFDSFRPRIGEKHRIGKGRVDQPLGKGLALRAAIQVGHVHQRSRLILYRLGQMRMAMAEKVHRDTRGKIQSAAAVFGNQPGTLTSHRPEPAPRIDRHQRCNRHGKFLP